MFTLPELPYDYAALGAYISKDVMQLHHDKHHQTYVDKLNAAIDSAPELAGKSVQELLIGIDTVPENIRQVVKNHGGGHYNHSLFWQWMSPNGGGEPTGDLAAAIIAKYGSFQTFVDEFTTKSLAVFGSGWTWLQPNLDIIATANQDSPLIQGLPAPILGLDVWEHAYYLDYKNKRDDYVKSWWNVVNWDFVSDQYNQS
jgi:Fe-Mn family superoxide dismutase